MVKRRKEEDIAGILEFEGMTSEDAMFLEWMADHKASNGGKVRVGRGAKGVRIMFSKEADMNLWQLRFAKVEKARKLA